MKRKLEKKYEKLEKTDKKKKTLLIIAFLHR